MGTTLPGTEDDVGSSPILDKLDDIHGVLNDIKTSIRLVIGDSTAAAKSRHTLHSLALGSALSQQASFDPIANAIMSLPSESPDAAGIDQDDNLLVYLKDFFISDPPGLMFGSPEYEKVATAYSDYLKFDSITDETEQARVYAMLENIRSKGIGFLSAAKLVFPEIKMLTWEEYKRTLYNKCLYNENLYRKDLDNNGAIYGVDFKFTIDECPYGLTGLNSQISAPKEITLIEYIAGRGI